MTRVIVFLHRCHSIKIYMFCFVFAFSYLSLIPKYFLAVYTILFCLFLYVCLLLYAIVSHGLSQHSGW